MILIFDLVVLLVLIGFIAFMLWISRKLIPEFNAWWKQANKFDREKLTLSDLKNEEEKEKEKARIATKLDYKGYESNKRTVTKTITKRRPS